MKTRIAEYDILKALAIFLVIWQHTMSCCGYGMSFMDTYIGKMITMINMPLFMFMVGIFSKSSITQPYLQVLKKKWNTLLKPMCIFCLLQLAISILTRNELSLSNLCAGGGKLLILSFVKPYWFIWALLYSISWLRLIRWISPKRINDTFCMALSWVILLLIPRAMPIPHFMYFQSMYIFFLLGILFSKFHLIELLKKFRRIFLICPVAYLIAVFFINRTDIFYFFLLITNTEYIIGYLISVILGTVGIVSSIVIVWSLKKRDSYIKTWLSNVGKYTLSIYLMQGVLCQLVTSFDLNLRNEVADFMISVIVFIILGHLGMSFSKNQLLAKYIHGRQTQ